MFCCLCSTVFRTSVSLFLINLSRTFLSCQQLMQYLFKNVIRCKNPEKWNPFLLHFFSLGDLPLLLCLIVSPKKLFVSCICFFSIIIICCMVCVICIIYVLILSCSVRYLDHVIWCVASASSAQRCSCGILSSFLFHFVPVMVPFVIISPMSLSYLLLVFCVSRSIHSR